MESSVCGLRIRHQYCDSTATEVGLAAWMRAKCLYNWTETLLNIKEDTGTEIRFYIIKLKLYIKFFALISICNVFFFLKFFFLKRKKKDALKEEALASQLSKYMGKEKSVFSATLAPGLTRFVAFKRKCWLHFFYLDCQYFHQKWQRL